MRKWISTLLMVFLIIICFFAPFGASEVKAAGENTSKSPTDNVYYAAILRGQSRVYYAVSGVSQYWFTDTADLGKTDSGVQRLSEKPSFIALTSENMCGLAVGKRNEFCNENRLRGALATLTINGYGDVTIEVSNGVTVTNTIFYYIVADYSANGKMLYCQGNNMCENSKFIGAGSNWSNLDKNGSTMIFSTNDDAGFVKTEKDGGALRYTGYNIINNMPKTYFDVAKLSGAYVVAAMSVQYEGINYYINYDVFNDKSVFMNVGNQDAIGKRSLWYAQANAKTGEAANYTGQYLAVRAALIHRKEAPVTSNDGYNDLEAFFIDTGIPALKIIIIIMFLVTGSATMINIVKASDEPDTRRSEIKRFIGLFTGAFAVYLILEFYDEFIDIVSGWIG